MSFQDYVRYDGVGLADLVKRKEVSPLELVEAAIERIERHNPALNAVVWSDFDHARDAAKKAGETDLSGAPFAGVPFLIKDLGCPVGGWPRTSGSRFTKDEISPEDGELTKRYRAAGTILLGKTNTPEFGITGTTESALLGPARNPWNPEHIAGGSSGGAAGAVASGMVPLAHASDGLGSIRIPAACCGLVGLKTTRDRNPNGVEDADRAIGFSVDHVVSRTVRDTAAMLDATGYPEPGSPYAYPHKERPYTEELSRPPGKLRIAFHTETPSGRPVDPEIRAAVEATAKQLQDLGHEVFERGLNVPYRKLFAAQRAVSAANFRAGIAQLIEATGREPTEDEFEALTWRNYHGGGFFSGEDSMRGWRTLRVLSRQILLGYEDVDAVLSPVLGRPVPKVGYVDPVNLDPKDVDQRQAEVFPFTPPCNFTGQPSISLPLQQDSQGLPIGMMFSAKYADEATLIRLAAQLEEAHPWADRHPPVWD